MIAARMSSIRGRHRHSVAGSFGERRRIRRPSSCPAVQVHHLAERLARQRAIRVHGPSDRHHRTRIVVIRQREEFPHLLFAADMVGGDRGSESQGETGKKNALHSRIDAGTADLVGTLGIASATMLVLTLWTDIPAVAMVALFAVFACVLSAASNLVFMYVPQLFIYGLAGLRRWPGDCGQPHRFRDQHVPSAHRRCALRHSHRTRCVRCRAGDRCRCVPALGSGDRAFATGRHG